MGYEYNYAEPEMGKLRQSIEWMDLPLRAAQLGLINYRLNDFYKKNGISEKDIDIKNHMRHMGGSALMASKNWLGGRKTAKYWGDLKEGLDIALGKTDSELDLQNNQIGRDIGMQNRDKNTDEILQKVYEEVLRRYKSNQ